LANTNIINASGNYLSAVNNGLNPSFSGGTLTLLANDSSSQNFTLNAGGGTLESPSSSTATLSGDFSGVGKLTINGSGTIVLSGNNTYSGGTQVDAGSTLSINSGSALGSGQLTLNGTSTTPATLTTTAPTTNYCGW
jgi:autotransporter-associated beta strand protein